MPVWDCQLTRLNHFQNTYISIRWNNREKNCILSDQIKLRSANFDFGNISRSSICGKRTSLSLSGKMRFLSVYECDKMQRRHPISTSPWRIKYTSDLPVSHLRVPRSIFESISNAYRYPREKKCSPLNFIAPPI